MNEKQYFSNYEGPSAFTYFNNFEKSNENLCNKIESLFRNYAELLSLEINALKVMISFVPLETEIHELISRNLNTESIRNLLQGESEKGTELERLQNKYEELLKANRQTEVDNFRQLMSAKRSAYCQSKKLWQKHLMDLATDNARSENNGLIRARDQFEYDSEEYLRALYFSQHSLQSYYCKKTLQIQEFLHDKLSSSLPHTISQRKQICELLQGFVEESANETILLEEDDIIDMIIETTDDFKAKVMFEGYFISPEKNQNELFYIEFSDDYKISLLSVKSEEIMSSKLLGFTEKDSSGQVHFILDTERSPIMIKCFSENQQKILKMFISDYIEKSKTCETKERYEQVDSPSDGSLYDLDVIAHLSYLILKNESQLKWSKVLTEMTMNDYYLRKLRNGHRSNKTSSCTALRALRAIMTSRPNSILLPIFMEAKSRKNMTSTSQLTSNYMEHIKPDDIKLLRLILKLYETLVYKKSKQQENKQLAFIFTHMLFFDPDNQKDQNADIEIKLSILNNLNQLIKTTLLSTDEDKLKPSISDNPKNSPKEASPSAPVVVEEQQQEVIFKVDNTHELPFDKEYVFNDPFENQLSDTKEEKVDDQLPAKHSYLHVREKERPRAPGNLARNPKATLLFESQQIVNRKCSDSRIGRSKTSIISSNLPKYRTEAESNKETQADRPPPPDNRNVYEIAKLKLNEVRAKKTAQVTKNNENSGNNSESLQTTDNKSSGESKISRKNSIPTFDPLKKVELSLNHNDGEATKDKNPGKDLKRRSSHRTFDYLVRKFTTVKTKVSTKPETSSFQVPETEEKTSKKNASVSEIEQTSSQSQTTETKQPSRDEPNPKPMKDNSKQIPPKPTKPKVPLGKRRFKSIGKEQ